MTLENKENEILPELQINPQETPKEKEVPIEVIDATLSELDEAWVNDIGKPYIKPGAGPDNLQ